MHKWSMRPILKLAAPVVNPFQLFFKGYNNRKLTIKLVLPLIPASYNKLVFSGEREREGGGGGERERERGRDRKRRRDRKR